MSEATNEEVKQEGVVTDAPEAATPDAAKQTFGDDETGKVVDAPADVDEEGEKKPEEAKEPEGERPEWLPEKFKSPEDMAKSYSELEKKLTEKGKMAPEEYEIEPRADDFKFNTKDESFSAFQKFAKENNFNNEQFNKVLGFAADNGLLLSEDAFEKEKQALGKDGEQVLEFLDGWGKKRLNEEEQEVMRGMAFTADQVKLWNKVVKMSDSKAIPTGDNVDSKVEVESMNNKLNELLRNPAIKTDNNLKRQAEELANQIAKLESK